MDTAVLALRTVLALVVVVGLVVVLGRVLDDRAAGRTQGGIVSRLLSPFKAMLPGGSTAPRRRRPTPALTLVGRQALGPKASVAVVDVGDQRLVLGVSEAGVTLLTSTVAPPVEAEPAASLDAAGTAEPGAGTTTVAVPSRTAPEERQALPAGLTSVSEPSVEAAAPVAFDEVFAGIVGQQTQQTQQTQRAQDATQGTTEDTTQDGGLVVPTAVTKAPVSTSPIAGSVLSPATWRQAVSAVQTRTRR